MKPQTVTATTGASGETFYVSIPDPRDAWLRRIVALLNTEGEDHDAHDDECYEAFMSGHFFGCASCKAAYIARALLEGRTPPEKELRDA